MNSLICVHIIGYIDSNIGEILVREHTMPDTEGEFVSFYFCPLCGDEVVLED